MAWAVSKKKIDFVGKRSFARADTTRADRKQLVGLLPVDRATVLPEGAQIVGCRTSPPPPPVPMLGHVTSSYRSAALGRTVRPGPGHGRPRADRRDRARPRRRHLVPVEVTGAVLVDPEGARRDG